MKAPLKGQVQREGGSPWWSLDSGVTPSAVAARRCGRWPAVPLLGWVLYVHASQLGARAARGSENMDTKSPAFS